MTWTEVGLLIMAVVGWAVAGAPLAVNRIGRMERLSFQRSFGSVPPGVADALKKELAALVGADAGSD